jgi:hypothetical protein
MYVSKNPCADKSDDEENEVGNARRARDHDNAGRAERGAATAGDARARLTPCPAGHRCRHASHACAQSRPHPSATKIVPHDMRAQLVKFRALLPDCSSLVGFSGLAPTTTGTFSEPRTPRRTPRRRDAVGGQAPAEPARQARLPRGGRSGKRARCSSTPCACCAVATLRLPAPDA